MKFLILIFMLIQLSLAQWISINIENNIYWREYSFMNPVASTLDSTYSKYRNQILYDLSSSFAGYWYVYSYLQISYPKLGGNTNISTYHQGLAQLFYDTKDPNRKEFVTITKEVDAKAAEVFDIFRTTGVQVFQEVKQSLSPKIKSCMKTFEPNLDDLVKTATNGIKSCADTEQTFAKTFESYITDRIKVITTFMSGLTTALYYCYFTTFSYSTRVTCTIKAMESRPYDGMAEFNELYQLISGFNYYPTNYENCMNDLKTSTTTAITNFKTDFLACL